jgi:hypothetical protein
VAASQVRVINTNPQGGENHRWSAMWFAYIILPHVQGKEALMDKRFQAIVTAAVSSAKRRHSLLWAEALADRIAAATPLEVDRCELAERLTVEAARQGVAVSVARKPEGMGTEPCLQ